MSTKTKATTSDIRAHLTFGPFSAQIKQREKPFYWLFNPLNQYSNCDNIRQPLSYEASKFPDSNSRALRQYIAASKHFPKVSVFNLSTPLTTETLASAKSLRYLEAPICHILDITSQVIASNRLARLEINSRLQTLTRIPTVFYENFKQIRTSTCGNIRITPQLDFKANEELLLKFPQLKESFYDFNWILTDDGLDFTFDLILKVLNHIDEYIVCEPFCPTTFPNFEAHDRTTLTACFSHKEEETDPYTTVQLLAGHKVSLDHPSLGKLILKAAILNPTFLDASFNKITQIGNPSFEILISDQIISGFSVECATKQRFNLDTQMPTKSRSRSTHRPIPSKDKQRLPSERSPKYDNLGDGKNSENGQNTE
jgi:hypothetical protein